MPIENRFYHQQYPTKPVIGPVLRTLNVDEAGETDFSKLHTALKIGRVVLVHGTFMGDDPFGIAETLKSGWATESICSSIMNSAETCPRSVALLN